MATAERVLWETITVIVFVVLLAGTVFWSSVRTDRHRARLEAEFDSRIATAAAEQRAETERIEEGFRKRARAYEVREAEAVFRSFEAAIRSAMASRWGNYVRQAKSNLLESTNTTFVHILTPAGLVFASSDEKLAQTGTIDERGDWALSATELTVRGGAGADEIELAGPIGDGNQPIAYLWMGYDLEDGAEPSAVD